jgi:ABC-2 type transport system permease protein
MLPGLWRRLRTVRASAWLGFQIEANWSDPFLFAVYAMAKPLASALILLVMYRVVVGGALDDPRFVALYLGNALYMYVILLLVGLSWAVFEDREQYKMLKYMAITPHGLVPYLLGRSWAKFLLASASVAILLAFGIVVLGMRFAFTPAAVAGFLAALVLGVVGVTGLGLVLSGCALVFARQSTTCCAAWCSRRTSCRAGCRRFRLRCRSRGGSRRRAARCTRRSSRACWPCPSPSCGRRCSGPP